MYPVILFSREPGNHRFSNRSGHICRGQGNLPRLPDHTISGKKGIEERGLHPRRNDIGFRWMIQVFIDIPLRQGQIRKDWFKLDSKRDYL